MPALPWNGSDAPQPDREYVVMASRLPLRSYRRVPGFLRLTAAVRRQLAGAPGLAGYSLRTDLPRKTFFTLSAWESQERLDAFARAMPHAEVMARLRPHMAPTTFVHWTVRGSSLPPAWDEALARLRAAEGSR